MFTRLAAALAFTAAFCGASGCCNGCCGSNGFGAPPAAYGAAPSTGYGNYAYAPAPGATAPATYAAPMVPITQPAPGAPPAPVVATQPQAVRY